MNKIYLVFYNLIKLRSFTSFDYNKAFEYSINNRKLENNIERFNK